MAVTKIWAIHDSISRVVEYCSNPDKTRQKDLEQIILYASDKKKTTQKEEGEEGGKSEEFCAVTGINCNADTAAREMENVLRRFGKTSGNILYHAYQSFRPGEVSAEECHLLGVETARRLWGENHQVLVATHFNTGTYHNHLVLCPVNMWNGKKLEAKYSLYYGLRSMSDRICKEHGLSVVNNPQRHKTARSVYFAEKRGEPTRFNLMREALDKALSLSSSWYEMTIVLRKLGYIFDCDVYRKYPTIRPLHSKKCTRTFRLGPKYDKEAMTERILDNQRDFRVTESYFAFLRPYTREYARKNPPSQMYYRRRDFYFNAIHVTGYLSLFRCIAIILGIAPLYERQYQKPLSPECREACRRLDRYSDEVALVCREGFETVEDIQAFIARMNTEIDEATAARNKIRNKQRNCTDAVKKEELKKQCSACTTVLADLRKRKKTACNIIEDSPRLRELAESEFEARLENDPYLTEREKRVIRQEAFAEKEKQDAGQRHIFAERKETQYER